eukprot:SAG25_NODE_83_length_16558_cov_10.239307_1_plen_90_part_00
MPPEQAARRCVTLLILPMVVSHTEGSEGNWSFVLLQLVCYTLIRATAAVADATKRLHERVREVSAVGVVAVEAAPREQEFGRACVVYRM